MNVFSILLIALGFTAHSDPLTYGTFTVQDRHSAIILAAPHGGYDLNTEKIVAEVSQHLNCSSLLAVGFRTKAHPINVNRPSEGIGLSPQLEKHTPDALVVFEAYQSKILAVHSPPKFYVEIHGGGKLESRVEVATVGVTILQAKRLKELFQQAFQGAHYTATIEGVDDIAFKAGAAKKFGMLSEVPLALHIELPWTLRHEDLDIAIKALEEFLPKAYEVLK